MQSTTHHEDRSLLERVFGSIPKRRRPSPTRLCKTRCRALSCWVLFLAISGGIASNAVAEPAADTASGEVGGDDPAIGHLSPDAGSGYGYRLEYTVAAPLNVMWRFKTDFRGDFFHSNRYIQRHRLIDWQPDRVITEVVYSHHPGVPFQWETVVHPERRLLEFVLLSPEKSGQRFHHGWIRLLPMGDRTRVIHVAYFDFTGAFLWVHYPFRGGMKEFLRYMARWEQETVPRLRSRYEDP